MYARCVHCKQSYAYVNLVNYCYNEIVSVVLLAFLLTLLAKKENSISKKEN